MAKGKRNKVTKKMKAEKKRTANNKLLRSKPKTKSEVCKGLEYPVLSITSFGMKKIYLDLKQTSRK